MVSYRDLFYRDTGTQRHRDTEVDTETRHPGQAPVEDKRHAHLVSDEAQHWKTPNTIPPLVMRSKKLTLVQAFQQAAQKSARLSDAASRVTPCEADGANFGRAGVNTQHTQDATDLLTTHDGSSAKGVQMFPVLG